MRSDSYPHQWGACRRPVISAEKELGNHFPLLFRALHTAGNRVNVRTLPEDTAHARIYDRLTEMCTPVRITGENFRKAKAREKMEQLKTLLNRKESL